MPSLNATLGIALQSLQASQGALNIIGNNIANSNTPGYTREVVNLTSSQPVAETGVLYGTGVTLEGFTSVRDQLLQLRIYDQTQQVSDSEVQAQAMQQAETIFANSNQGVGTDITALFNSLSELSTNPGSPMLRQSVVSDATSLASDFNSAGSSIGQVRGSLDQSVVGGVRQVNDLTSKIATLGAEVAQKTKTGQDPGVLEDQRQQLISQLSQLVGIHDTKTESGDTLSFGDGTPLVVGDQAIPLTTSAGLDGMQHVYSSGKDVTSVLRGGSIGGAIHARDVTLPNISDKLDALAYQFSTAINAANKSGFDQTGSAGGNVFNVTTQSGAALRIGVMLSGGAQIAASSDGTPGSAGNIATLLAVKTTKLASGMTPIDAFSDVVFAVGDASSRAQSDNAAGSAVLSQLQQQRSSISGVSLDEETTSLIRYQQSFQAAAKVVSTIDQLYSTLITM